MLTLFPLSFSSDLLIQILSVKMLVDARLEKWKSIPPPLLANHWSCSMNDIHYKQWRTCGHTTGKLQVDSGSSSLLAALLGELHAICLSGRLVFTKP